MTKLSEKLILSKTRLDKLGDVRNLNLWGQDLDDVSILQQMPAVEVLSLSVNKIKTLQDFMYCRKLQELYLRKNDVQSLSDVRFLVSLPELSVLWLSDNPCADSPNYREQVVNALPGLIKLDNEEVTSDERSRVAAMELPALPRPATPPPHAASAGPAESSSSSNTRPPTGNGRPISGRAHSNNSLEAHSQQQDQDKPSRSHSVPERRSNNPQTAQAQAQAPAQTGASNRRPPTSSGGSKSDAVLYAVLKLLDVLDDTDLMVVKKEIDMRTSGGR